MIRIRPAVITDAAELAALYTANRAFLQPWDPVREEEFFTTEGQRARLQATEVDRRSGTANRCVIQEGTTIIGMVSLTAIERGPAQSAHLGYWVGQDANGRGVATEAVRQILTVAFDGYRLHRVQAGTLPHNAGSQKVLGRNGFEQIGLAKGYLKIAGEWQDHILFQRLED